MKIPTALLALIALPVIASSADHVYEKSAVIPAHKKYTYSESLIKYFPFGSGEIFNVFALDNHTVRVCERTGPCKDYGNKHLENGAQIISGPFVAASIPSWIELSKKSIKLCGVEKSKITSTCVKLDLPIVPDIEITYKRKGVSPILQVASSAHTNEYLNWYGSSLRKAVFAGSIALERTIHDLQNGSAELSRSTGEQSTQSEDMPIVIIDGPAPPYDGGGGGGIITVPMDPGGGGGGDTGGGGGGGGADPCTCEPTPEEKERKLKQCIASAEWRYYEWDIPKCQESFPNGTPTDNRLRAQCYAAAADEWADAMNDCRDRWK